jgi:TfoX/Sxy family transcriptional regulator of competence genes
MPYDEDLAASIREIVVGEPALTEKKMFGGIAFLIGGNMAVAASGHGGLMVRVDPADSGTLVSTTPARMIEMRGRPMRGWLYLDAAELGAPDQLTAWVKRGVSFARSLPGKYDAGSRPGLSPGRRSPPGPRTEAR